ncbi:hypothetical protein HAX54_016860 [Datura stramonium]|uniref:Uncharacterized protein n=1 Tax=Datura stramonium TaxID=4076 RepID=A0ABS8UJT2_DATST|nr:hypothetical protein [Datura stramonium]
MAAIRELLGEFPKPPPNNRPSSAAATSLGKVQGEIAALAQAHVELWEDLERERRRQRSRDKLLVRMWKGIKKILKTLSPSSRTPQATKQDLGFGIQNYGILPDHVHCSDSLYRSSRPAPAENHSL